MQKFNHKTITEKHRRFYFLGVCDIGYLLLNDSNFSKKKYLAGATELNKEHNR